MTVAVILTITFCAMFAILAAQGWLLLQLQSQHGRIDQRIADLTRSRPPGAVSTGNPAPSFRLPSLANQPVSLATLLAPRKPVILFFVEPRCGPCFELLPDIGGWQRVYGDRISFALLSAGTPEANRAMTAEYGIVAGTVLLQTEREVVEAYGLRTAPAAVLIQPDGSLGGEPVYGAHSVRQLVAGALGLAVPVPPVVTGASARAARVGERVPALRRPDLDWQVIDFAALRGEETLLLFWSPGCGHCQQLLPALREWDAQTPAPRLLVVTRGPVAVNKEVGLRAQMILDDDRSLARAFGVQGTPALVAIDASGIVALEAVRGENKVRDELAHRFESVPRAGD